MVFGGFFLAPLALGNTGGEWIIHVHGADQAGCRHELPQTRRHFNQTGLVASSCPLCNGLSHFASFT